MITLRWKILPFDSLSVSLLYDILRLRTDVFVVEQNCPYPELDGKDIKAFHVCGLSPALSKGEGEILVAYTRVLPKGISYDDVSIGRVVVHPGFRGKGIGNELMKQSLALVNEKYGNVPVRISAQSHLQKMYERTGFKRVGDEYLEDNIPHVQMVWGGK